MIVVIGISIIIINGLRLLRKVEGFKESETEDRHEKEPFDDNFEEDEENAHLNKLEELNPKVMKAIQKLNSININDINEYIDTMKHVIDS